MLVELTNNSDQPVSYRDQYDSRWYEVKPGETVTAHVPIFFSTNPSKWTPGWDKIVSSMYENGISLLPYETWNKRGNFMEGKVLVEKDKTYMTGNTFQHFLHIYCPQLPCMDEKDADQRRQYSNSFHGRLTSATPGYAERNKISNRYKWNTWDDILG